MAGEAYSGRHPSVWFGLELWLGCDTCIHAHQDLVHNARKTLSEQLLRRTDYALAEIAFLTGFSDQSTFTRAFKRWHGQTPASYRRGGSCWGKFGWDR